MSKRHGGICGNPAVADGGINFPSCGASHLSLGSLNLKGGFCVVVFLLLIFMCPPSSPPYYSLLIKHSLGSQLQLYISEDRLLQL